MINRWRVERAGDPGEFLDAARKAVESGQADDRLCAIALMKDRLPDIEEDAVEQAIAAGSTWARIAESLGVSRQAIFNKYGANRARRPRAPRRREVVEARVAWDTVLAEQERFALIAEERNRARAAERQQHRDQHRDQS